MFPFEQGALEMVLIGALALIVLGPKDLPVVMRRVGQFVGRMRGMAAEFRASFDELARQSELDELRKEVEALRRGEFAQPMETHLGEPGEDHSLSPGLRAEAAYAPFDGVQAAHQPPSFGFPPQAAVSLQPVYEPEPPALVPAPLPAGSPLATAEPSPEPSPKPPRKPRTSKPTHGKPPHGKPPHGKPPHGKPKAETAPVEDAAESAPAAGSGEA